MSKDMRTIMNKIGHNPNTPLTLRNLPPKGEVAKSLGGAYDTVMAMTGTTGWDSLQAFYIHYNGARIGMTKGTTTTFYFTDDPNAPVAYFRYIGGKLCARHPTFGDYRELLYTFHQGDFRCCTINDGTAFTAVGNLSWDTTTASNTGVRWFSGTTELRVKTIPNQTTTSYIFIIFSSTNGIAGTRFHTDVRVPEVF
jgi:hypothetical protein